MQKIKLESIAIFETKGRPGLRPRQGQSNLWFIDHLKRFGAQRHPNLGDPGGEADHAPSRSHQEQNNSLVHRPSQAVWSAAT